MSFAATEVRMGSEELVLLAFLCSCGPVGPSGHAIATGEPATEAGMCRHPDAALIERKTRQGAIDLVFDRMCRAWIAPTGDGPVFALDAWGRTASEISGTAGTMLFALAVGPGDEVAVVAMRGGKPVLGWRRGDAMVWARYRAASGTPPTSIVHDGACVWIPGVSGRTTLSCLVDSGHSLASTVLPQHADAIAFDGSRLFAAAGAEIFEIDVATGAFRSTVRLSAPVVDIAADDVDGLYVETADDRIEHMTREGARELLAQVSGDGRLAISPDGWLVRMVPASGRSPRVEEWPISP